MIMFKQKLVVNIKRNQSNQISQKKFHCLKTFYNFFSFKVCSPFGVIIKIFDPKLKDLCLSPSGDSKNNKELVNKSKNNSEYDIFKFLTDPTPTVSHSEYRNNQGSQLFQIQYHDSLVQSQTLINPHYICTSR